MNGYDDENGNRVEGLYEKTLKLNDKYEEAFKNFIINLFNYGFSWMWPYNVP